MTRARRWRVAAAGYQAFALDIRGHGASGTHGRIGYIGQLEDNLVGFVAAVAPPRPRSRVGFSAGGGHVLRFAANPRRSAFDRVEPSPSPSWPAWDTSA